MPGRAGEGERERDFKLPRSPTLRERGRAGGGGGGGGNFPFARETTWREKWVA